MKRAKRIVEREESELKMLHRQQMFNFGSMCSTYESPHFSVSFAAHGMLHLDGSSFGEVGSAVPQKHATPNSTPAMV
jgi:hypothetical protein